MLLHTTHYGRLTPVCEALQALLFPFYWQHVYVPLLPLQFLEYLQAPVPFIMGVHTDFLSTRTAVDCVSSVVMVHLDFNKVRSHTCRQRVRRCQRATNPRATACCCALRRWAPQVVTPMNVSLPGDVAYDMVPELPAAVRHRLIAHIRMHAPPPRELGHENTPAAPVPRVRRVPVASCLFTTSGSGAFGCASWLRVVSCGDTCVAAVVAWSTGCMPGHSLRVPGRSEQHVCELPVVPEEGGAAPLDAHLRVTEGGGTASKGRGGGRAEASPAQQEPRGRGYGQRVVRGRVRAGTPPSWLHACLRVRGGGGHG